MSMAKTPPRFAAARAFSKSSACPRKSFRRCRNSTRRKVVTIRQKDLRDGLKKTSYAISTDETRYVLNGILFSFKENKLTLVATDGRRLAMLDIELEFPRSHEADIIVPTKAVTELQRLLDDEGDVRVSVGERPDRLRSQQHAARLEVDRGKLSELPPGHPRRDEGARHARARNFPQLAPPRLAARERQIELGQTDLRQEQHRHHREHAGSRRSEGVARRSPTKAANFRSRSTRNSSWRRCATSPKTKSFST